MAAKSILIRLVAEDGSGHFYTTRINKQNRQMKGQGKLTKRKYNPVARRHMLYKEEKIK